MVARCSDPSNGSSAEAYECFDVKPVEMDAVFSHD